MIILWSPMKWNRIAFYVVSNVTEEIVASIVTVKVRNTCSYMWVRYIRRMASDDGDQKNVGDVKRRLWKGEFKQKQERAQLQCEGSVVTIQLIPNKPVLGLGTIYRVSIKLPFIKLRRSFIVTEVCKCKSDLSLFNCTYLRATGTHKYTHTQRDLFFTS